MYDCWGLPSMIFCYKWIAAMFGRNRLAAMMENSVAMSMKSGAL